MKTLLIKADSRYRNLLLSLAFALFILAIRVKITHSTFYLFLVWNLFLAAVPFLISQAMRFTPRIFSSGGVMLLGFSAWLLFLPNSPYIITDLVHLHNDSSNLLWLDLFLVFVFAFNGLLLGLLSLLDMFYLLGRKFSEHTVHLLIFASCILSGYGIYLGRFLRFNSWDILTQPSGLFHQIVESLYEPKVWLMTLAFGGFLWILLLLLQSVKGKEVG